MTTQQQQGQHGTERSASEARSAGAVRSVPPLSNTGINESLRAAYALKRCLFPVGFLGRCGFAPKNLHKPNGDWVHFQDRDFHVLRNTRSVERAA